MDGQTDGRNWSSERRHNARKCIGPPKTNNLRGLRGNGYGKMVGHKVPQRVMVRAVALLVARRTNNRKVVGSIPANIVCITVLTGNRLG